MPVALERPARDLKIRYYGTLNGERRRVKMKKMISIAAIVTVVSVFAFAGCKKETAPAPKPAEQSSGTTTVPPVKKAPKGC